TRSSVVVRLVLVAGLGLLVQTLQPALEQGPDLRLPEPAVPARSPDATDSPSRRPSRHGLRVDAEQRRHLTRCQQTISRVHVPLLVSEIPSWFSRPRSSGSVHRNEHRLQSLRPSWSVLSTNLLTNYPRLLGKISYLVGIQPIFPDIRPSGG